MKRAQEEAGAEGLPPWRSCAGVRMQVERTHARTLTTYSLPLLSESNVALVPSVLVLCAAGG